MDPRLAAAIVAIVGVRLALLGYVALAEAVVARVPARWRSSLRPWLWIMPALTFVLVFLVYPTLYSLVLSVLGASGPTLDHYASVLADTDTQTALRNNAIWLVLLTAL